jgi:hypothetical protein
MAEINMWAYRSPDFLVCSDATLDGGSGLNYPEGNDRGQAGWDIAVSFDNLLDLSMKMTTGVPKPCDNWFSACPSTAQDQINRLAIQAHGVSGSILIDSDPDSLTIDRFYIYQPFLQLIGLKLSARSLVIFPSCLAARGKAGTELFSAISKLWPSTTVVGFSTLGYTQATMRRTGEMCENPGVRSTDNSSTIFTEKDDKRYKSLWNDFITLPWASEKSPYAKVVKNGAVLKWPVDEKPGK